MREDFIEYEEDMEDDCELGTECYTEKPVLKVNLVQLDIFSSVERMGLYSNEVDEFKVIRRLSNSGINLNIEINPSIGLIEDLALLILNDESYRYYRELDLSYTVAEGLTRMSTSPFTPLREIVSYLVYIIKNN